MLIVVDPPFVFRAFWKMLYPFIDANTKKKILFVSGSESEKQKMLAEFIDPAQVLRFAYVCAEMCACVFLERLMISARICAPVNLASEFFSRYVWCAYNVFFSNSNMNMQSQCAHSAKYEFNCEICDCAFVVLEHLFTRSIYAAVQVVVLWQRNIRIQRKGVRGRATKGRSKDDRCCFLRSCC